MNKRQIAIEEAKEGLERYLQSPQSNYVCEYLSVALGIKPLMRDSPHLTAYQVGMFEVVETIKQIQETVRGNLYE